MGDNRVVVLVDMDCFYCQVEVRLNPAHRGKPLAVVQYNAWRGGGIIAVNYEARDKGVKRGMRGNEAQKLCPDIVLCRVAEVRGKADLTKYRDAGREIVDVLHEFSSCIQVASIDESYLDITEAVEERMQQISEMENGVCLEKLPSTFVIGYSDDKSNDEDQRISGLKNWLQRLSDPHCLRLTVGAMIAEEMRAAVYERTSFRCSAGISYNKPLAKLVCAVHKPNRQTVLPADNVALFFSTLPVRKMRNLGGKFGSEVVERLGCQTMGDLASFSLRELQRHYDEKNGLWLYNIAHGIDHEPVTVRLIPKSIGCSKNFPGKTALGTKKNVEHWMRELTSELVVRLTEDQENNKRRAQLLTVSIAQDTDDGSSGSITRSGPLPSHSVDRIVTTALQLITKTNLSPPSSLAWNPPIKLIGLSAGKFTEDCSFQKTSIQSFFKQVAKEDVETSHSKSVTATKTFEESDNSFKKFNIQAPRKDQNSSKKTADRSQSSNGSSTLKQHLNKRLSIDSYFTQSDMSNHSDVDNDSSRDIYNDDTSIDSDSSEIPEQSSAKGITCADVEKELLFRSNKSLGLKGKEKDSSCASLIKPAVCPENLDEAVSHSFFARYILARTNGNKNGNFISSEVKPSTSRGTVNANFSGNEPKPSTSRENFVISPECAAKESETETFDTDIAHESEMIASENDHDMFERCVECSKMIPLQDFPEHVDYHSALNLQKELNDNLTPPDINVPSTSKSNLHQKQLNSRNSNDSSSRDSETIAEEAAKSEVPVEKCSYCSKFIPLNEFPEHIDYHSAVDLQRELNKAAAAPASSINVNSTTVNKKRKGRQTKLAPSPAKKVKVNSIASFFGPK